MPPAVVRTVAATRYVTPLRQGGSLPALVEADDDGLYVVKLRGAGQGPKALVAELVVGEIGRALGLLVPEIALVELDVELSHAEPDPEIQELLARSAGLNAGLDFLPGSLEYSPAAGRPIEPDLAAEIVWFDAFTTNVDRTVRNPNLLVWHDRLWLIDHGAALYVQHHWRDPETHAVGRFEAIRDHVLLPRAGSIAAADERLAGRLGRAVIESIVAAIPDDWLAPEPDRPDPASHRAAYVDYLLRRLAAPRSFVEEAERARAA
jgi:hypothetical protein